VILTPGGFEQIVYSVKDTRPEKIPHLAAEFGCDILGPPVADESPAGSDLVGGGEAGMTAKDARCER
jgi:hypothetical protein